MQGDDAWRAPPGAAVTRGGAVLTRMGFLPPQPDGIPTPLAIHFSPGPTRLVRHDGRTRTTGPWYRHGMRWRLGVAVCGMAMCGVAGWSGCAASSAELRAAAPTPNASGPDAEPGPAENSGPLPPLARDAVKGRGRRCQGGPPSSPCFGRRVCTYQASQGCTVCRCAGARTTPRDGNPAAPPR